MLLGLDNTDREADEESGNKQPRIKTCPTKAYPST